MNSSRPSSGDGSMMYERENTMMHERSNTTVQDQIKILTDSMNTLSTSVMRCASVQSTVSNRLSSVEGNLGKIAKESGTPRIGGRIEDESQLQQDVSEIKNSLGALRRYIQQEFQSLKVTDNILLSSVIGHNKNLIMGEAHSTLAANGSDMRVQPVTYGIGADPVGLSVQVQEATQRPQEKKHGVKGLDAWTRFQSKIAEVDTHSAYRVKLEEHLSKRSIYHKIFSYCGMEGCLPEGEPENALSEAVHSSIFTTLQTVLILTNTVLMGYETNAAIQAALKDPQEEVPEWINTVNLTYNLIFGAELILRMAALRVWFFVSPHDWGWNFFDMVLVTISLVSDWLLTGLNLSFIRTLRILRAVRVARIIRVLRFFRELRQMLFAILGCLSSLAWAFVFLAMLMFMFSVLFLQGAVNALTEDDLAKHDLDEMRFELRKWYSSLDNAMLGLLAAVTGGADWLEVRRPLEYAGGLYSAAFIMYMLFVTVGVMNVLTGVFLGSADELADLDLVAQTELIKVEQFVAQMVDCWKAMDPKKIGAIDWEAYHTAMANDLRLRMFLTSIDLDPNHVELVFDLLDEKSTGSISLLDFVIGMVKLRGTATAIDAKTIVREISMVPQLLKDIS